MNDPKGMEMREPDEPDFKRIADLLDEYAFMFIAHSVPNDEAKEIRKHRDTLRAWLTRQQSQPATGGVSEVWRYKVRDVPQYPGQSLNEYTEDPEQADIMRRRGYVIEALAVAGKAGVGRG